MSVFASEHSLPFMQLLPSGRGSARVCWHVLCSLLVLIIALAFPDADWRFVLDVEVITTIVDFSTLTGASGEAATAPTAIGSNDLRVHVQLTPTVVPASGRSALTPCVPATLKAVKVISLPTIALQWVW